MSIYEKEILKLEEGINTIFQNTLDEKLTCKDPTGKWIKDFQDSDDPKFKGKSKEKRKEMALGARYGKCNESFSHDLVEYAGEMTGEKPFIMGDGKYEYCWGIYPDGKKDIAVYSYRGDVCLSYDAFRDMYGIK